MGPCMFRAAIFVLLLSWVVPDHFPPWLAFHTEIPAFVATVLALIAIVNNRRTPIILPPAVRFIIAISLVPILQQAGGLILYRGDLIVSLVYILTFACAWLWGYRWGGSEDSEKMMDTLALGCVAIGVATTFQILAQWLLVEDAWPSWVLHHLPNSRPRANVGQPNQAATALLIASVALGILAHREKISAKTLYLGALVFGIALTLTQSRTALLSASIVTILFLAYNRKPARGDNAVNSISLAVWLLLLYGAAYVYTFFHWEGPGGAPIGAEQMASVGTRPLIWMQLLEAVGEKPWWGWGWLQVPTAQQMGGLSHPGVEQVTFSHNVMIDLLVYSGVPVATIVFVASAKWCFSRCRRLRANPDAAMAFILLLPFAVHAMLEFPHAYSYFLVLSGLLLGVIDAWTEEYSADPGVLVSHPMLAGLACAWAAVLLALASEYMRAEEDFRINRFENARIGVTPSEYTPPKFYLLTQLGDLMDAMRLRAKPGMSEAELSVLLDISKRYSWAKLLFRAALALGLNDRPQEAAERMQVLKSIFPQQVYEEAKTNWYGLQNGQYPELARVQLP